MTTVFVHGVPETAQIWDGVRERIGRPARNGSYFTLTLSAHAEYPLDE